MAVVLIRDGVVVNAIAPGAFASDVHREARDDAGELAVHISSGRIGVPEDIAAAAVYLTSRAGDYVVGSTLVRRRRRLARRRSLNPKGRACRPRTA